jgi:hypothetical protein
LRRRAALALLLGLGSCRLFAPQPTPNPTYVVGAPYQAGGTWRYPRETFEYDQTRPGWPASPPNGPA